MPLAPSRNSISHNMVLDLGFGKKNKSKAFGFPKSQQANLWLCSVPGQRGDLHPYLAQDEQGQFSCAGLLLIDKPWYVKLRKAAFSWCCAHCQPGRGDCS